MIAVIQRVSKSSVTVNKEVIGEISKGVNILLGVKRGDNIEDAKKLINKIANLRIFEDENGKMNFSLKDIKGEALIISQFTLTGSVKKGRRPSFENSETPAVAKDLYLRFTDLMKKEIEKVETGEFGAMMDVKIFNDGPVTFILDSREI